jgi:hypothetical protein
MTGSTSTEKHHSLHAGILIVMLGPVLVFRSSGQLKKKAAMSFCKQALEKLPFWKALRFGTVDEKRSQRFLCTKTTLCLNKIPLKESPSKESTQQIQCHKRKSRKMQRCHAV